MENGNIVVYTEKKDVFISLLEKHISLFILENGYIAIPTCPLTVQIGDHISISPLSKTSSLWWASSTYIYIYIYIYMYVYHCTSNTIFVWILFIFNSCNSCYDFFCIEFLSIAARDNDNFVFTFFLVMRLNIIIVISCALFIKKRFPCCSSLKLKKGLKKPLKARSNKVKFVKLVVIFITEYTLFWLGTAIPLFCGLPWMYYENRTRTS